MVAAVLACGALAAGCGGGDDNNSSGGGDNNGSGGGSISNPQTKQAVAQCKQSVDQASQLSSSVKSDLKDICEKAGKGDESAVRKATREVCVKIVEQNVPAGPARDQAKQACNQGAS
jgi:hypothetical protein